MRPSRVPVPRVLAATLLALGLLASTLPAAVGATPVRTFVPIGSDYQADTLQLFARAAAARDSDGTVVLLVLPITYSLNAYATKNSERQRNLTLADHRRGQVEAACAAVAEPSQTCSAQLVPVLIRPDAFEGSNLAYFDQDVDGMYVLGGDQTVAMQVTHGTPLEARMSAAHQAGAPFGGNSAGMAVQSTTMINGYAGAYGPAESLRQGAVDLTAAPGLSFGLTNVITDQHVFELGRTGRSLNVAVSTGTPVVGMDAATGGIIRDQATLSEITGDTAGYVVDPGTWGATAGWVGPNATLSTRGVAVHLLPPGWAFDLAAMEPVVGGTALAAPDVAGRTYPIFATANGAGPLLLSGGISADPAGAVGQRLVTLAGGNGADIVVLVAGAPSHSLAVKEAKAFAAALQPLVERPIPWFVLDAKVDVSRATAAIADATGIVITGTDRSQVAADLAAAPVVTAAVHARWASGGATLLADDAGAAAMGATFIADGISADVEASAPDDLLAGGVAFGEGLGWVAGLELEPRLLPDQNWAQLLRLAAEAPGDLAVGIDVGTGLEVRDGGATVVGESAAVVFDGRSASFGTGSNTALAATWLVVDSFADGEVLAP